MAPIPILQINMQRALQSAGKTSPSVFIDSTACNVVKIPEFPFKNKFILNWTRRAAGLQPACRPAQYEIEGAGRAA
jgi:hypothetical protein